eukprot:GHVT01001033.1.p1 GENE.GHVT01001033.1~~GHVT01001033.1.p1  ORF type:complete len:601 (+),score=149.13 GHVT01001033.1:199-1803(+)
MAARPSDPLPLLGAPAAWTFSVRPKGGPARSPSTTQSPSPYSLGRTAAETQAATPPGNSGRPPKAVTNAVAAAEDAVATLTPLQRVGLIFGHSLTQPMLAPEFADWRTQIQTAFQKHLLDVLVNFHQHTDTHHHAATTTHTTHANTTANNAANTAANTGAATTANTAASPLPSSSNPIANELATEVKHLQRPVLSPSDIALLSSAARKGATFSLCVGGGIFRGGAFTDGAGGEPMSNPPPQNTDDKCARAGINAKAADDNETQNEEFTNREESQLLEDEGFSLKGDGEATNPVKYLTVLVSAALSEEELEAGARAALVRGTCQALQDGGLLAGALRLEKTRGSFLGMLPWNTHTYRQISVHYVPPGQLPWERLWSCSSGEFLRRLRRRAASVACARLDSERGLAPLPDSPAAAAAPGRLDGVGAHGHSSSNRGQAAATAAESRQTAAGDKAATAAGCVPLLEALKSEEDLFAALGLPYYPEEQRLLKPGDATPWTETPDERRRANDADVHIAVRQRADAHANQTPADLHETGGR